jgi:DNA replication protein DnaC
MADAMLDRIMQSHHRFTLSGESLRKKGPSAKAEHATKNKGADA